MLKLYIRATNLSYAKRRIGEADKLAIRDMEKSIKEEIKERLTQANKQREVCHGTFQECYGFF